MLKKSYYELDSSSTCMQHTLLVVSGFTFWSTLISIIFGAYKWYHYIALLTSLVSTIFGLSAAYKLNVKLLLFYAIFGGIDFIVKILNAASLIFYRVKIKEDCMPYDSHGREEDCPGDHWRNLVLNISNGIIFYFFSAVLEIILFTFSIYLFYTVKKYRPLYAKKNSYSVSQSMLKFMSESSKSSFEQFKPYLKIYAIVFLIFPAIIGLSLGAAYLQILGE